MKNKETPTRRSPYQAPEIRTMPTAEILEMLGPAVAIYGQPSNFNDPLWG